MGGTATNRQMTTEQQEIGKSARTLLIEAHQYMTQWLDRPTFTEESMRVNKFREETRADMGRIEQQI